MNFKQFLENIFGDDFDIVSFRAERKARGSIVDRKPSVEKDTLKLYHGFNKNPKSFNYSFDPSLSQQGLLWFTHNMIRGYDPYEYASGKGKYVLTYDLPVVKKSEIVTYQNGKTEKIVPDELRELAQPTSNCRYLLHYDSLIELPENWFFTYKNEKFIGTSQKIQANPSMVREV